jgi:hypothetical protein
MEMSTCSSASSVRMRERECTVKTSAQSEQVHVRKLTAKDVLHGFRIPILVETVPSIASARRGNGAAPGLVQQRTVTSAGSGEE